MKRLNLAKNQLETLPIKINLDVCDLKLESLNISSNLIKHIDIGYLIYLTHFNISHNQLTTFNVYFYDTREYSTYSRNVCNLNTTFDAETNENIFISNLVEVDFSYNRLSNMPFTFVKGVAFLKLEKLLIVSNQLRIVTKDDFKKLTSLRHISLRSNLLNHLDNQSFFDLTSLKYLDMSYNFIEEIPQNLFVRQNSALETLLFAHNRLGSIPKEAFRHLESLKYLNLNGNRIKHLGDYSFGFMKSLVEVSLASNQIETIANNTFNIDKSSIFGPGLIEKLDLSGNNLTFLNDTILFYLTNLRHLVLSNNRLKFIDRKVFRGLSFLITLDLSFNQLDDLGFLANRNFSLVRYLMVFF